jgi:hypothetical protein
MMTMKPLHLSLLAGAALVTLVWVSTPKNRGPEWFPLRAGERVTYDVHYSEEAARDKETWTLNTRGPVSWQGKDHMLRHHSQGVAFFLEANDQGVRRVAHQTDLDREPLPDEVPQWVLKAPYTVGTEWTTTTVPYLLMRKNEHPRELKHSHKAQMSWRIESVSDKVKLRSGEEIAPCLHVVGQAFLNLYTDPVNGFSDVPLTSHEWYCKGRGLVKFTREEKVPAGFMTGGSLSAEVLP